MKTPDFTTAKSMPHWDCEIQTARGGKFYVHRAVLSTFSPLFEELFSGEQYEGVDVAILDMSDRGAEEVAVTLGVIYQPDRNINGTYKLLVILF